MKTFIKALYIGAAVLAVVSFLLGGYAYFIASAPDASLVVDVIVPLGIFVVLVLLYRRRKADLES